MIDTLEKLEKAVIVRFTMLENRINRLQKQIESTPCMAAARLARDKGYLEGFETALDSTAHYKRLMAKELKQKRRREDNKQKRRYTDNM